MPFSQKRKPRASTYDKIARHAMELLRQELQPLRDGQNRITAQNEKITEYIRQIWDGMGKRDTEPEE
ncbi:MAG TPA: hypothetical protein PKA10_14805 [Selenomonadales bacterium]|nr:hypothetical protein [Selenomonadales bacterium]